MAICIECSKGELSSGYSYTTSSRSTGCIYNDFDTCMRINNPKQAGGFDIDTTDNCISFFIDNAQRWTNAALLGTPVQYGGYDNNTNTPINRVPFAQVGDGTVAGGLTDLKKGSSFPLTGEIASRLWAYDIKSGATYFVGGLAHEGSDIGVTSTKMFMTTEYNFKMSRPPEGGRGETCWWDTAPASVWENFLNNGTGGHMRSGPQLVGIIEYGWGWTPGDLSTFTSAATSYYRIVTENGQLLSIESETTVNGGRSTMGASSCARQHDINGGAGGLGASLAAMDDTHIIVSDEGGGLWLVDLEEFYTGPHVYSYSGDGSTTTICNNINDDDCVENWAHPNNNYGSWYGINLTNHDYRFNYGDRGNRTLTDAWFAASHQTGHKVKTVIARRFVNLNAQFNYPSGSWEQGTWGGHGDTMGDVVFNPVDRTIPSSGSTSISESEQFSSGTYTQSIVVTWKQGRKGNVSQTSDGQYYTRKRISKFVFPLTSMTQTNWAVQRGGGYPIPWHNYQYRTDEVVGNTDGGGVTVPDAAVALIKNVYTNKLFTSSRGKMYEVDTNTLVLNPGTNMNFRYFDGVGNPQNQLINCYSASSTVTCNNPNAFSMRGGAQAPDCLTVSAYTYDCGRFGCTSVLGNSGMYPTYSACTADCVSWSCQTICVCPSGYTLSDGNCVDWEPVTINNGITLVEGSESSVNGQYGTKFCTNYTCSSPHTVTGPTTGIFDGMFGGAGQYLTNGRLNDCGVWPGASQPSDPALQNQWHGISKCIAASSDTRYLIGIAADNYFRISINGATIVDTLNNLNSPVSGPIDDNFKYWYVIPVDVEAGNNSFTIEGYDTGINASLAVDIIGPFQTSEWTTITDFSQWSDLELADIYNNNKIWSTCDLLNIGTCGPVMGGGLDGCDLSNPVIPVVNSTLIDMGYPDPWRETTSVYNNILDPNMVYSDGLPPGHVPGWGAVGVDINWAYSRAWALPDMWHILRPWFASGVMFTDPNTGVVTNSQSILPGDMIFVNEQVFPGNGSTGIPGYNNTGMDIAHSNLTFPNGYRWGNIGGPNSNQPLLYGNEYCSGSSLNPPVIGTYGESVICRWTSYGGNPTVVGSFTLIGFGPQPCGSLCFPTHVLLGSYYKNDCVGCPPGEDAFMYQFDTWTEVIDWLNSQGLTQSPIIDPNNPSVPITIDYSADYWDVVHAIQAYWTPANPQPVGSCVKLVETQPFTYGGLPGGGYAIPVHFYSYAPKACECTYTNGIFETQINECPPDYVWDGCINQCVSITACTTPDGTNLPANYTGGCVELIGTGQTDTYETLVECELSCTTTSTGTTFWNCTNTGCVTGTTGNYLDLITCQAACYSFSCDTAGCQTFNQYAGGGTGGTYTDSVLCGQNCISYNCGNFGCTQQSGSGGTFSTQAACTGTCLSYECLYFGCESYVGTGFTYQELSACTGVCLSYVCEDSRAGSGCTVFNPPPVTPVSGVNYYGTGATSTSFMGSGFSSVTACQVDCVAWGCNELTLRTGTTVYGFLDTSSMDATQVQNAVISLSAFTDSLPGWNGNLYFTLIQDERWVSWPRIVYSGVTAYGGSGLVGNVNGCFDNLLGGYAMSWAIGQGIDANFYDNCNAAVQWAFPFLTFPTKGLPPTADGNDDILIVTFCDENGPDTPTDTEAYHCNSPVISNTPQYSSCTQTAPNMYFWQPTFAYKQDYTGYTSIWESVTATTTGVLNAYLYSSLPNQLLDAQRIFALHSLASISSGNKLAQDGTWNINTAPRTTASGGILGGTPGLCDIADLTVLEQQINPYVSTNDTFSPGGYGKLDKRGWGVDVGFLPFTQPQFTEDLSQFLTIGITSTTGCISAETLTNNVYPSQTLIDCQTGSTTCVRYSCTNTGCIQITGSTLRGMYDTLEDCTGGTATLPACTSYSCNTTGCTLYNIPNYGTGGTFTDVNNCVSGCTSFNCIPSQTWYNMNPGWPFGDQSWDGCEQQLGSGGTFSTYVSCTADCKSWECESPCSGGTGAVLTGCTEYPNTGATHIVESACTGTCLSLWYCIPESITNWCDGRIQLPVTTPPDEYDTLAIWDVIADQGWNSFNVSTFSFPVTYNTGGAFNWPGPCPNYYPDCCLDNNNNPLMFITEISCTLFPTVMGFPQTFYSWADLIGYSNGLGITSFGNPLDLTMSFMTVATAIQGHYNAPPPTQMMYLHFQSFICECTGDPCSVICDNGSGDIFNVYPNATGPHASSADAYSICCAATYDCVEESDTNSCSGRTTISGVYTGVTSAMEWVSTNLPNTDLSTLIFESSAPPTLPTVCEGPNGGALHSFEPMSYSLLNNGNDYYTWNGFIQALTQSGLQGVASGMSFSYVDHQLEVSSARTISLCASNCSCIHTPCHCIEIDGSGGTYTQLTDCLSACTCDGLSGTSFNCVNNTWNYQPICNDKQSIGTVLDEFTVVDWFRQFAPYDSFATRKTVLFSPISGIIPGVTHLNWSEVQANMLTNNPWEDCYKEEVLSFTILGITWGPATFYLPWTYVETISHPLVNGGALYSTYNTFFTAAINAGVSTLNYNMTLSGACMEIDNVFGTNYGCDINKRECCNEADCYCYELFVTGGTYNTDADCQSACCPTYSSFTCDVGSLLGCYPSTVASPGSQLFTGANALIDCMACVANPMCECYSATSWNCITGTTIYSCEDFSGVRTPFLDQNSPGTLGASGVPLVSPLPNTNQFTFTYPLTASTIQSSVNSWYPAQAEALMTTDYYWNNNKFFSATTWELNPAPIGPDPCIGPNNGVLHRLISVSHGNINNFTPYYKWSDFLAAAQLLGFGVTPSTQINALEFAYNYQMFNNWEFDIEPCTCSREELKDCYCEEVYGLTGQFTTSALCETYCCEPIISYNCTLTGCVDPLDGSGMFFGATALIDCEDVCYEWECCHNSNPPAC